MVSVDNYLEKYGIVILLDSLGTKGIWKERDPKDVLINWSALIGSLETDKGLAKKKNITLEYHAFSDTIIITLAGKNNEELLHRAAVTVGSTIIIGMVNGISLRGCMSIGKFYSKDNMVLGPAINDYASKGTHKDFKKTDAVRCIVYTYLVLGDILHYYIKTRQ